MKYKYYSIDRDYGNRRVTKRRQRGERGREGDGN